MAVDFPKFFTTAAELYDLWPSLFNWAGGIAGSTLVAIVTATWWMRGYKADAREAALAGENVGLNGQIEILKQRLALATEQQAAAEREAEGFRKQLDELKEKVAHNAPARDIQVVTTNLDVLLGRLLTANNATTATLTFAGPRGVPILPQRQERD
jgi:outer membrane murein-binding lipoprotein Lpp